MEYDLELERVASAINEKNAKLVCIQLPDGMKTLVDQIQDHLEKHTKADIVFWGSSNFGACDIPIELTHYKFDMLIHFGHSRWKY